MLHSFNQVRILNGLDYSECHADWPSDKARGASSRNTKND